MPFPQTSRPAAALFDCDGVILDTEGLYSQFWAGIGHRFFPSTPSFASDIKGLTLTEIIGRWFKGRKADCEAACAALQEFEDTMDYRYIKGARELLEMLREAGVKTALVTSSDRAKMCRVHDALPELLSLFTTIVTAEDITRCKPAPDAFLTAAQRLDVQVEQCVAFEDSVNGLRAARASGAVIVGLTTTNPLKVIAPLSDVQLPDFAGLSLQDFNKLFLQPHRNTKTD